MFNIGKSMQKNKPIQNNKIILIPLVLVIALLSATACGRPSYTYNNLLEADEQKPYPQLEKYLHAYSDCAYASEKLKAGWQTGHIGKENYDYTSALTLNGEMKTDINCRICAFLLLKDAIQCGSDLSNNFQLKDSLPAEFTEHDKQLYRVLFGRQQKPSSFPERWDDFALSLPENVFLLTAWQNEQNLHAGVLYKEEDSIRFFEKVDPVMPFQLSKFNTFTELQEYLLKGRFKGMPDVKLFLNDKEIGE